MYNTNFWVEKSLKIVHLVHKYWLISLVGKVFTNGLGDLGSILGRVVPKTLKMVLDIIGEHSTH